MDPGIGKNIKTWFKKLPVKETAIVSEGWRRTSLASSVGLNLMQPRQFELKMHLEQLLPFALTRTYSKMFPLSGLTGSRIW